MFGRDSGGTSAGVSAAVVATYAQWAKAKKTPRVSWVCGSDAVLVGAVVTDIRTRVGADPLDLQSVVAGDIPVTDIWAALNQYGMDPAARKFLLVRQAQRIKDWEPLADWLKRSRQMPSMFVCFVSDDEDFPAHDGKDGKRVLDSPVADIKGRGAIVRCAGSETELAAYVATKVEVTRPVLQELLTRTGYSSAKIKDVLDKAAALGLPVTQEAVRALSADFGADDVVSALFYRRIPEALRLVSGMDSSEASRVIGTCSTVLDYMEHLYPAVISGSPLWEVVARGQVPDYPARIWWGAAKHFDPISREKARTALVVADQGASVGGVGALEALVGLW